MNTSSAPAAAASELENDIPAGPGAASYPSLRGRTALVTGGASGIGAAIVTRLAEQGVAVAFLDIAQAQGERTAALVAERTGTPVHFVPCDLTDIAALRAAIDAVHARLGDISILVNNAASDDRHDIADVEPEYFDERMAVNLRHQFFAAQAVRPGMARAGRGAIVNIGSHAWYLGAKSMSVYLMAKAGVAGLTKALARELGPEGIRVNHVVPGWVMTERQRRLWWTPEAEVRRREGQCIPAEVSADDVAQMVLFLASDAARSCTNQTYFVDGGRN